jgi:hypothetical protein
MNKDLQAKIEEEVEKLLTEFADHKYRSLPIEETIETLSKALISKALIEFLVPYVVELARELDYTGQRNDVVIYKYETEDEILAIAWEELK